MFKIKKLTVQNFMSVGNVHQTVDFDKKDLTLVLGENVDLGGDDDRGMAILEWGEAPVYQSWPDQPRYRVYSLSDILNDTDTLLQHGMHCRVNIDIDISYEEASFIKENLVGTYGLRELTLIPVKNIDIEGNITMGNVHFESIDTIVSNQLMNLSSDYHNPSMLLDIYRHL